MEIKKGDVFECIKDVVMPGSGRTLYFKGKCYTSEKYGCITDEIGDDFHQWGTSTEEHFRKLSDVKQYISSKHQINENIGKTSDNTFKTISENIADLLEYKNAKYGNSALEPIEVFNGKSKVGQRIDDKLSRIKNSEVLTKNDIVDTIGYLFLVCKENNWTTFEEFKD